MNHECSLTVRRVGSYNSVCVMLEGGPAPASGNNSVVECDLAKVEVVGSNPISRSITFSDKSRVTSRDQRNWAMCQPLITCHLSPLFGRGTQVVRERSAKPLCVSSILTRASTSKILKINCNTSANFNSC